jgi:SAM-dependent methyltransferase
MALIAEAAAATTPRARHALDVGCGAGNYTLKLLVRLPNLDATLIDLSQPMLDRARERVSRATAGRITTIQADIREVELPDEEFDMRPGGSLWVFDLVESSIPAVGRLMRQRYGEYLTLLKDESYRDQVFAHEVTEQKFTVWPSKQSRRPHDDEPPLEQPRRPDLFVPFRSRVPTRAPSAASGLEVAGQEVTFSVRPAERSLRGDDTLIDSR